MANDEIPVSELYTARDVADTERWFRMHLQQTVTPQGVPVPEPLSPEAGASKVVRDLTLEPVLPGATPSEAEVQKGLAKDAQAELQKTPPTVRDAFNGVLGVL